MLESDPKAAIERLAIKLLGSREHSRLELGRKLAARGFGTSEVELVLDRLAAQGALDEDRLAELYVAERVRKGFGPVRIRRELRDKGLPDSAIEPQLAHVADHWPERLAEVHARRFGPEPPGDRDELGRRARFLEQRGFPLEAIRRFLRWND